MINISIDPPDLKHPKYSPITNKKDLAINKIESVFEMIAEGVFDKEIPESDEDEIDISSPSFELYFVNRICSKLQALVFPVAHFPYYHNNFLSVHQEPHFPPPRLA